MDSVRKARKRLIGSPSNQQEEERSGLKPISRSVCMGKGRGESLKPSVVEYSAILSRGDTVDPDLVCMTM